MFGNFSRALLVALVMSVIQATPAVAEIGSNYNPTRSGGNFGLGLELGGPGDWGATAKIWIDRSNAFQPAVKFNGSGSVLLQLDYLWHYFNVIEMKETSGEMPLYVGLGGNLQLGDSSDIAGRIPVGISYIFDKRNVPVDIYLQAVPTLWFFNEGSTTFKVYGELGAHYYF